MTYAKRESRTRVLSVVGTLLGGTLLALPLPAQVKDRAGGR